MKILLINSSFRQDGNTSRVLDLVEKSLKNNIKTKKLTLETETISLSQLNINICRGCRVCLIIMS